MAAVQVAFTHLRACDTMAFGISQASDPKRPASERNEDVTKVTTYFPKEIHNDWLVVDADGKTVGRLATQVASLLRGKHKPDYTPHQAGGDYVIVLNAEKIVFSGNKLDQKVYTRYSGYPGGLKKIKARTMLDRHPDRVVQLAVWGMLPKNRLGRKIIRRLKIYAGPSHPHQAQQPKEVELS